MVVLIVATYIVVSKYYVDTPCLRDCRVSFEEDKTYCRTRWMENERYESMKDCLQYAKEEQKSCIRICGKKR